MKLGKISSIACLTYIVYGLMSIVQLNTFLPPIPAKPFLFALFFLFGFTYLVRHKFTVSSTFFLVWLFFYSVTSHSILEVFLANDSMLNYEAYYADIFALLTIILFMLHVGILSISILRKRGIWIFLLLSMPLLLTLTILSVSLISTSILIVCWSIIVYTIYMFDERLISSFNVYPILFGAGVIEFVELIARTIN